MSQGNVKRHFVMKTVATVMACTLLLTGCSGLPFDLPFDLPSLPFEMPDLSGIPNPFSLIGTTSSVEEARDAKAKERESSLTIADLVADGVLTVGIQNRTVSAPFYIEGANGIYGIDVDLASALADHLGLDVRFVPVNGFEQPLSEGVCDIVMNVSANHTGSAKAAGSYYESSTAFFTLGEPHVATVDELRDKTVAVQDGSFSQGLLSRSDLTMKEQTFINLNEAFDALAEGKVDYVLCEAYLGAYLAAAHEGINFAGSLNAPSSLGIVVSAEKEGLATAVQNAIDSIAEDGEMDIIRSVWLGDMPTITEDQVIQGISITGSVDNGSQDGSSAGANAVVF